MRTRALLPLLLLAACAPAAAPPPAPPSAPPPAATTATPPAKTAASPDAPSGYDRPPSALLDVMHSPNPPTPVLSPKGDRMLLVAALEYPSMARVAEPFYKLAGVRVEPKSRAKHDTPGGYGIRPCARDFTLVTVPGGVETKVALPQGACPAGPSWAPDGAHFFFTNTVADAVELWIGDASNGQIKRVGDVKLNPMLGSVAQWMADNKSVLVKLVPENPGAPPPAPVVPPGPSIQDATAGGKGVSSTYETRDTLKDKHDEALFDYYGTSQLAVLDTSNGTVRRIGKPALYTDLDVGPDGVHVIVDQVKRPYSYVTTYDRFPHEVSVWDLGKADGAAHVLASLPLADRVPVHGVPTGPRGFNWRQNEPATLVWAEALDGGDWKQTVPARDKVMMQKAPFTAPAVEVVRTEQRFVGFQWGSEKSLAFMHEHDDNKHWQKTYIVDVDNKTTAKPAVLWDLSTDEKYKAPGNLVMTTLPNNAHVVRQEGDVVYLAGTGASPAGDRPFLDRLDLKSKKTERLFRSEKTALEQFIGFASQKPAEPSFVTWHQSPTDAPNAFLRTVGAKATAAADEPGYATTTAPITKMADPVPAVRAIKKRLVKYKRKDGVDLSFTLYTPPGYQEGTKIPAILYAYPLDYADPSKAGQVSGSEQTFTRLKGFRLLLLAGYAVIDNAAFPIVGDPKKAYDTYLDQLTNDAKAAVDEAVKLGVVDPDRVGVTGHSHGALMTVNLLAHTDLFRAGVATSGSYNKTLTPFGFQNERRSVWEAQDVYVKASPFFYADKLKKPTLIMHGEDDANPGTTPLQATKLFEAIRGNGGTTRLVMLPHEPHWYTAMESNEQVVAEMLKWFDTYVKNAPAKNAPKGAPAAKAAAPR